MERSDNQSLVTQIDNFFQLLITQIKPSNTSLVDYCFGLCHAHEETEKWISLNQPKLTG